MPESEAIFRQIDRDENVNGRRGTLRSQKRANPDSREGEPELPSPEESNIKVLFILNNLDMLKPLLYIADK